MRDIQRGWDQPIGSRRGCVCCRVIDGSLSESTRSGAGGAGTLTPLPLWRPRPSGYHFQIICYESSAQGGVVRGGETRPSSGFTFCTAMLGM